MAIGGEQNNEQMRLDRLNNYRTSVLSALDQSSLTSSDRYHDIRLKVENLLLKVVNNFKEEDQMEIVYAVLDMIRLHADQQPRLSGKTVVEHLLEVANLLFNLLKDPKAEEIIVAILHDAVEDQYKKIATESIDQYGRWGDDIFGDDSWQRIIANLYMNHTYGEQIGAMLSTICKPDYKRTVFQLSKKNLSLAEFQTQKNRLYLDYLRSTIDDEKVGYVKLADFITNAADVDDIPDEYEDKRISIKNKYYDGFAVVLEKIKDPKFASRLKDPENLKLQLSQIFSRHYEQLVI